ncbi:type II TA system antitoxin MqsA family protein [Lacibacterium aquatile]|uniref:Type II TA system antitoxin MqsA family protein n=1 Tax=Lacibacterium aquatile TaxID=1168082 RepID=A0ABW5DQN3_9PROT
MTTELLKDAACPACGVVGRVSRVTRCETVPVRDLEIEVNRTLRVCDHCKTEFENTKDADWKIDAYAAYRSAKGMVTPEQIREWRKSHDLTQPEVTRLLGWGDVTLSRYENGALQSDAHNRALSALMEPVGLGQALENNPDAVLPVKKEKILSDIREAVIYQQARQMLESTLSSALPDITNGCRAFNADRAAALISIVTQKELFKTSLNKVLFYSDFLAFHVCGHSISGLKYARINYGPVPDEFDVIFPLFSKMGVVTINPWENKNYFGEMVCSRNKADINVLTPKEQKIANIVRKYFEGWSATRIKDFSHQERAWLEVSNRGIIPYNYASDLQIKDLAERLD